MLEKLTNEIRKEYNGYMKNAEKRIKDKSSYCIEQYLTPKKWEKYISGDMTRKEAEQHAIAKMKKQYTKDMEKEISKIESVAEAKQPTFICIRVEWHKSRTWGANPAAEVTTGKYTKGTASGCGYDKESAAVASALNDQPGIMGAMYRKKNKHPRTTNHKLFGYGSGYGAKPYFEGGVGMTSLCHVLEAIGYIKTSEHHGKMSDFYDFELKKGVR